MTARSYFRLLDGRGEALPQRKATVDGRQFAQRGEQVGQYRMDRQVAHRRPL